MLRRVKALARLCDFVDDFFRITLTGVFPARYNSS
jgi:hypothetical protein